MLVAIYDIDYFNSKSTWNYDCMKIASYHKQMGDKVFLMQTQMDLDDKYDLVYVCRESNEYDLPSIKFWNDKNRIFGNCEYMNNYEVPTIMLACRPDYSLYPFKKNYWYRSDAVQLFDGNGKLLSRFQDPTNAFKNKRTLVIDKAIWKSSTKDLLKALSYLKELKNISFLYPISMNSILSVYLITEAFKQLNLSKKASLVWLYDITRFEPDDYVKAEDKCISTDNSTFNKAITLLNYIMEKQGAAKGNIIIDGYHDWRNLISFCGIGRLNGFWVNIAAQKKSEHPNITDSVLDDLREFQGSKNTNLSFIEYLILPHALSHGYEDPIKYLLLINKVDEITAAKIKMIGEMDDYSSALIRAGTNIAPLFKKDLLNINVF
jgi:hypothetical protein